MTAEKEAERVTHDSAVVGADAARTLAAAVNTAAVRNPHAARDITSRRLVPSDVEVPAGLSVAGEAVHTQPLCGRAPRNSLGGDPPSKLLVDDVFPDGAEDLAPTEVFETTKGGAGLGDKAKPTQLLRPPELDHQDGEGLGLQVQPLACRQNLGVIVESYDLLFCVALSYESS